MDPMLLAAEAALRSSAAPALPVSFLKDEIRTAVGFRCPSSPELLAVLRRYPERFKVLDPGKGPWRFLARSGNATLEEPWVVSLACPDSPPEGSLEHRMRRRVRESVRSVAVGLDADSPREVFRWRAMALAVAVLLRLFREGAA